MSCSNALDAATLVALTATYAKHPAQAMHKGKVLVSTFSGSECTFGTGSTQTGWGTLYKGALKLLGVDIFFVPSIFSDISTFGSTGWMDGELNWNSAWPSGANSLDTSSDVAYMKALGSKEYMPAISPAFFTHFPPWGWNKNWIYRGDDWLYATRWEQVIAMRDKVVMTEILTWNDYGESSYIGPIAGALPAGSEVWTNGFDHTAWLPLTKYYATAFKTGSYPAITKDSIIMWARPHPKAATATSDSVGRPDNWQYADDNLYAIVMATGPATVTLTSGATSQQFSVSAGLNKLKMPSAVGSMSGKVVRSGSTVASYNAGSAYTYTETPKTYNFNYFVGASS
jgi:glucan endo-1,3-alpha-glucosidase